jgi:hypothetical protein
MHFRAIARAMMALTIDLALHTAAGAQEVASIDLTKVTARMDLRRPEASSAIGRGRTGVIRRESCLPTANPAGALHTTLVSLDRTHYQVGDQPTFEITIENVGSSAVKIPFSPISPNLVNLQPENPALRFTYSEMDLMMWIVAEGWSTNTGGGPALYGSDSHPDTVLTLNPGEWARITGKGKFDLSADASLIERTRLGDAAKYVYEQASIYSAETLLTPTTVATVEREVCLTQTQGQSFRIRLTAP